MSTQIVAKWFVVCTVQISPAEQSRAEPCESMYCTLNSFIQQYTIAYSRTHTLSEEKGIIEGIEVAELKYSPVIRIYFPVNKHKHFRYEFFECE